MKYKIKFNKKGICMKNLSFKNNYLFFLIIFSLAGCSGGDSESSSPVVDEPVVNEPIVNEPVVNEPVVNEQ